MKKVILSLFLLLTPSLVKAASVEVTDYLVDAYILENGDMEVHEIIVAEGTFNYYERDLLYQNSALASGDSLANNSLYNASDITNVELYVKEVADVSFATFNDTDFTTFTLSQFGSGSSYEYTTSYLTNGYRYRMYYQANNEKIAFYIKYTVEDVVVLHEDVAEVYWTFVPDGFEDTLNNVQIKVHLPSSDTSDLFRFWAHGNLAGEITKLDDNSGVYATISSVMTGESVDIRLTFNPDLVSTAITKQSGITALSAILEVEEERAEVANALRSKLNMIRNGVIITSWLLIGGCILLSIYVYIKYGKSPKASYYSKYNREFIDDYNVEVIDYLMNRNISPNALSASIMNLIYKKNIKVKEIPNDKRKQKDYEFSLINMDNINDSEKILISFLFDTVGGNTLDAENHPQFTTNDLKKYASSPKTCDNFVKSYTAWKENVLKKGREENFFVESGIPKVFGVVILIIAICLLLIMYFYGTSYIPSYIAVILAIIFFIYTIVVYKKTVKGSEHYARWKAFKNFLKDFGAFDLKELPEIVLWERYLVYATIFGLAEAVEKSMNVHINEIDMSSMPEGYYPIFIHVHMGPIIHASFHNALNSAYHQQRANYANTHSRTSSGGGFGGGFSSGGGFGGGGGGGRFG